MIKLVCADGHEYEGYEGTVRCPICNAAPRPIGTHGAAVSTDDTELRAVLSAALPEIFNAATAWFEETCGAGEPGDTSSTDEWRRRYPDTVRAMEDVVRILGLDMCPHFKPAGASCYDCEQRRHGLGPGAVQPLKEIEKP